MDMKIAFIGGGNMASSLVGGLIADGYDPASISVADISQAQLDHLKQQYHVNTDIDAPTVASTADIIIFSVKPQHIKDVAIELSTVIKENRPLVISIAAGIRTKDIGRWIGAKTAIVRAMPNTPALLQSGATALFANPHVTDERKDQAESIMRAAGIVVWVEDEALMNVVTALSGSGPAYFFRLMEGMEAAAIKLGLPKHEARILTLQTAMGAGKMALEYPDDIARLRRSVTSPGGTTEQGLRVMDEHDIDRLIQSVVTAAHDRSIELADELGEQ